MVARRVVPAIACVALTSSAHVRPNAQVLTAEQVRLKADAADGERSARSFAAPTRLAILIAEDTRARTPRELAILRAGAASGDLEIRRTAIRALGRLERPALIPDIIPSLRASAPEVRAEAANAIGQAAEGWRKRGPAAPPTRVPAVSRTSATRRAAASVAAAPSVDSIRTTLVARLKVEAEPPVRAAITETLGRLPYTTSDQVSSAESALVQIAPADTAVDRLGIAKGAEALVRLNRNIDKPSGDLLTRLRTFVSSDPSRDARVRRLALEALIASEAIDEAILTRAVRDPDPQVRRIAMRAASSKRIDGAARDALALGMTDPSPLVRIEVLRSLRMRNDERACDASMAAASDSDEHVVLFALDELSRCGASGDTVALLERTANDLAQAGSPRGWHRAAHALVALATASLEHGSAVLPRFLASGIWQLRMYAARAATALKDRARLEALAADENDNVCEVALDGLLKLTGHASDGLYVSALERRGYQAIRAAALALAGTPASDTATAALKRVFERLTKEGRDNSLDARVAIAETLGGLGVQVERPRPASETPITSQLTAEEVQRLASARARVTMRDLGTFELALFASEAPASVVRFGRLAEAGYYNGLTFHRVVPNFVIQGGSPGANEYIGDASFMRDELGLWPHVRGAVGVSTRGRDTGDAQIFIDLVDNPRLDHEYTVFAQVLNGMDVVDAILEGDVIERIDIVAP